MPDKLWNYYSRDSILRITRKTAFLFSLKMSLSNLVKNLLCPEDKIPEICPFS